MSTRVYQAQKVDKRRGCNKRISHRQIRRTERAELKRGAR